MYDIERLTPVPVLAASLVRNQLQNLLECSPRDGGLGHHEGDIAPVAHQAINP
jgi:hypothetical protein